MKTIVKFITAFSLAGLAASAFAAQQLSFGQLDGITAGVGTRVPVASPNTNTNTSTDGTSQGDDPVVLTSASAHARTSHRGGLAGVSVDVGGGASTSYGGSTFGGHSTSGAGQISSHSASGTLATAGGGGSGNLGFAKIDSRANASPYHTGGGASAQVSAVSFHHGAASAGASASTTSGLIGH
jgi:hypothetical protein